MRERLAARDVAAAMELLGRLGRRFSVTNELDEGTAVAAAALAAPGATAVTPWANRVLYFDGLYAFRQGDRERSLARNEAALASARSTGDIRGECDAITGLARIALREGDYARVVAISREARDKGSAAGDEQAASAPLHLLAAGTRLLGEYRAARALYVESLELNRRLGNDGWVSMEQHNLGWVELHLGDVEAAARWFEAAGPGSDAYSGAWAELEQAGLALVRGDHAAARSLLDAGSRTLEAMGAVADPDDQSELDWLRGALGR